MAFADVHDLARRGAAREQRRDLSGELVDGVASPRRGRQQHGGVGGTRPAGPDQRAEDRADQRGRGGRDGDDVARAPPVEGVEAEPRQHERDVEHLELRAGQVDHRDARLHGPVDGGARGGPRQRDEQHVERGEVLDGEVLDREQVKAFCPIIDISPDARYPIFGASLQRRAGVARHDAVAWGFARAADARGVDIIQNCEVTGIRIEGGRVQGVDTTRGHIRTGKLAIVVAGHSSVLAAMAGFRLPIQSHPLQALVSEPIKPVLNCVIMSGAVHVYVSQSDKGELVLGAGIDAFNSYAQRGSPFILEHQMNALCELFPIFSRLKMMRSWGGIVDTCPDASPIIGKTPVENLFINCGWGTGGFKATPGSGNVFAHTIARGEPHPLAVPFALERFTTGYLIDEHGAAGVAH